MVSAQAVFSETHAALDAWMELAPLYKPEPDCKLRKDSSNYHVLPWRPCFGPSVNVWGPTG